MTIKPALAPSLLTSATRLAVQLFMLAVAYPSVSICFSQPTSTALLATGTHFFYSSLAQPTETCPCSVAGSSLL